ncbi:MAG: peptidylprolyl isomerase [Bacilli bacterium]|nr:peptidylprolyl isomerase [Bacilli bacterium]
MIIPQKEKIYKEDLLGINYNVDNNEGEINYDKTNPLVSFYIKNYGSIVIELYPDIAPNTVNNFISLVKQGFYDNNSFHRLVPGFVLQGGDPDGNGQGGPGYTIKGEFTNNGYENNLKHEKWVVSMARSNDYDSAGSQFFICLDEASNLDGNYASFGRVIDGFDNIKNIVENEDVSDTSSGKLKNNLIIKKAIVDMKNYNYEDVLKITK